MLAWTSFSEPRGEKKEKHHLVKRVLLLLLELYLAEPEQPKREAKLEKNTN